MTRRTRSIFTGVLVALMLLVTAALAFVWWGPVPVSDKRVLLDFMLGRGIAPPDPALIAERLDVPDGFNLKVYSTDVPLARFMAATPAGDLIVTRTRADSVSILERDRDGDGQADGHRVLLDGLQGPHGVALHDGWLYLAERTAIGRAPFDVETGTITGPYSHILTGLTTDGFHQTTTRAFVPDGWLYLSQGSTCNVCVEKDPRRAAIMRMRPDGSGPEIFATGLRNSVGFDWAPGGGKLYATGNGRDRRRTGRRWRRGVRLRGPWRPPGARLRPNPRRGHHRQGAGLRHGRGGIGGGPGVGRRETQGPPPARRRSQGPRLPRRVHDAGRRSRRAPGGIGAGRDDADLQSGRRDTRLLGDRRQGPRGWRGRLDHLARRRVQRRANRTDAAEHVGGGRI